MAEGEPVGRPQSGRFRNDFLREAVRDAEIAAAIILGVGLLSWLTVWLVDGVEAAYRSVLPFAIFVILAAFVFAWVLSWSYVLSPSEIELTPSAMLLQFREGRTKTVPCDRVRRIVFQRRPGGRRHVYMRIVWAEPRGRFRRRHSSMMIAPSIEGAIRSVAPERILVGV